MTDTKTICMTCPYSIYRSNCLLGGPNAAYAANYATNEFLSLSAKLALDILIQLKSPGCKYL